MGKRAATKPKAATSPAPAGGAKRSKTAATETPLPDAPAHWARPNVDELLRAEAASLKFFLVDIEDGQASFGDELRLFGVTADGVSVCARLRGVRPYFYVRIPALLDRLLGREDALRTELNTILATARNAPAGSGSPAVLRIEKVRRTPVLIYQPEEELFRITVAQHRLVGPCVKALENGVRIAAGASGDGDVVAAVSTSAFEANVPLVLRFLVDFDLGGGRWVELIAGAYHICTNARCSTAQLEVEIDMEACEPDQIIKAVPVDTTLGSSVPPLRVVSIEVLVDSELRFSSAACVLAVQGERRKCAQAVWLLGKPSTDAKPLLVQELDPYADETPNVYVSESEERLLEHLGETLAVLDADILLCHDLSLNFRGLLGKKGIARAGSGISRGLSRWLASEIKMTPKSNEVSGLIGRLGFDLQKQVEKDHRLTDYSLGNLSEHFCQLPIPELSQASLARLLASQPRNFARHILRQAQASLQVFDQLAYLFNFVEMARVTGVPLAYLLERGQAVKVQAQLLQEARRRNFVLPAQRPGIGEENTFEGATVLEPACGFYRGPIAVLDFASLYPSIMLAHNLCYSTLLAAGHERRADAPAHSVSPPTAASTENNIKCCFVEPVARRGLLPSILERLLAARKATKKQLALCAANDDVHRKVLNGRQLALKLSANSVYGFTGAVNGPLPCLELAGAVTAYGREMIQTTRRLVEEHFTQANGYKHNAEVVYGDTDSVMVRFGPDDIAVGEVMQLSSKAAELCSKAFPEPVRLEFEKVYWPYLLMAKKRYAGLSWSSPDDEKPKLDTKGIETVRRDWSDLVRQGLERTLQLLLRPEAKTTGAGTERKNGNATNAEQEAAAYVHKLCDDLRQNRVDFRSLVISKSLGREDYAAKMAHVEVAEKLKKRDPNSAPRIGDRVAYLVLAGPAKAKIYEKAEDPMYALEHDLPVDAEYYLEHQLKQPLIRVFELVYGSAEKAEAQLFGSGVGGQKVVKAISSSGGALGKFLKPKLKCLSCNGADAKDGQAFCSACIDKGNSRAEEVKTLFIGKACNLREELRELRAHCDVRCSTPPGDFPELMTTSAAEAPTGALTPKETCANLNCQVIFRRVQVAKDLKVASDALARLKVADW